VIPTVIKVTFKAHFSIDLVEMMRDSEFVGLSEVSRQGEDPRVLYLQPTAEQYPDLKAQLQELEQEGALSFIEEF
jgi:hypothetical protein